MKAYSAATARPVPGGRVRLEEGYWKRVRDQARDVGLPRLYEQYEQRNIVQNFVAAATGSARAPYGPESDNARNFDEFLWKAMEAGAYYLADPAAERVREHYEGIRDIVSAARQPDGYIVTEAISLGLKRFSPETHHEMYNGGHLMQAGIAELRTSGERVMYDIARSYLDLLVESYSDDRRPMPRFRNAFRWPDHPNLEMALVEAYRVSGDRRYLDFCRRILLFSDYPSRTQLAHHAVQELLHACGGADYYLETGSTEILEATRRLWESLLKKVYITGGVGNVNRGSMREAAGKDFELSNAGAYAETCASVSLVFLAWRMFLIEGCSTYADMLERALYNGVQAGIARNGYEYFYENPLEYRRIDGEGSSRWNADDVDYRTPDRGGGARSEFHRCSCCPPNVQRLFASLSQYIYALSDRAVWINLFVDSAMEASFDGTGVSVRQTGDYPWNGAVTIEVEADESVEFALKIRIPGWCEPNRVLLNGHAIDETLVRDGYLTISGEWKGSSRLSIEFPMEVRLVSSHPKNTANYGKVVMTRGPLVYCLEEVDHPGMDISGIVLPARGQWSCTHDESLLGGVTVIRGKAFLRDDSAWDSDPFKAYPSGPPPLRPVQIQAVPYYAWANRGRCSMVTAFQVAGEE